MIEPDEIPSDRRYTPEHEWARREGDVVAVGITEYAQHELGDVVYPDLPEVGTHVVAMEEFGALESVKAASDIFAPVTGEVIERNEGLIEHPEWINDSPYDLGWIVRIRMDNPSEFDALLDAAAYRAHLDG
ncbi:MAG: glycine cleavage system protein GcvH [Chloroflexi bacterium]|nr:glycine cleavage system protein GcvH [Chloroflexota bacterium]